MDLDIAQMERFSEMQISCLNMMKKLIEYDRETALKNNVTPTNTRLVEAFIEPQQKALNAFADLLVKHKPALEAIKAKMNADAAEKQKKEEETRQLKADVKKAMSEEGSLFSCTNPTPIEGEDVEEPLLGEYDIEENDCDDEA